MKATVYEKYGSPDVLKLKEIEKPSPGDNEVLIRIRAATITPGDCELRTFKFPLLFWLPLRLAFGIFRPRIKILGQELSGEIESVGSNVIEFCISNVTSISKINLMRVYRPEGVFENHLSF